MHYLQVFEDEGESLVCQQFDQAICSKRRYVFPHSFVEFQAMAVKLIHCPHLSNPKCAKIFTVTPTDVLLLESSPS